MFTNTLGDEISTCCDENKTNVRNIQTIKGLYLLQQVQCSIYVIIQ